MQLNQIPSEIDVRPLHADDVDDADLIMRVAFGTFLGLPEPTDFMGDAAFVRPRWQSDPSAAFAAYDPQGKVVGSNFATNWGSCGFFGPLTIRPELWDRGVGQRLMEPVMDCFARWNTSHAGLFTFAQSPKHFALYQRFGFWPRFVTAVMTRPVGSPSPGEKASMFSTLSAAEQESALAACRDVTDAVYDGLDLTHEIRAVAAQELGDTVLLWDDSSLVGVAVCHAGPATEAGSGACYVKFGAVRPCSDSEAAFTRLLRAVDTFAATRGAARVVAGVNTGRHEAYRAMLADGFRSELHGVAMHRPNRDGYSRPGDFVIDDWR